MRRPLLLACLLVAAAIGAIWGAVRSVDLGGPADAVPDGVGAGPVVSPSDSPAPTPGMAASPVRAAHPLADRRWVGAPWGTTPGLTTFRGNPSRTWYGLGPVPADPVVAWRYPERPMCIEERLSSGDTKEWCGTGWTGQPIVWERPDGVTEAIVGAYDGAVHFVDADTGMATRQPFRTGHMVKGSETLDPDGFPLLYTGSRDGRLRILALDRGQPTELWALEAHPRRVWNDDWDGSPAIVDDVMYVGGEDSWFYAVKLNRSRSADGRVSVDPEVLLEFPGFTDELFALAGDRNVSIENSPAMYEGRVYFANSAGRVVGLDVNGLATTGEAPVVFDFWAGDDVDSTIVVDEEGMLYVAVELQRFLPRHREVGQLVKLDPYTSGDPIVWSVAVPPRPDVPNDDGGIWSTPALHAGHLYVTTHPGDLLVVDAGTGEVVHRDRIGYHEWASPVVVDDVLVVSLCDRAGVRAYDVSAPAQPVQIWETRAGGCVESTPAVWDGRIIVGSRDGYLYSFSDSAR